MVLVFIGLAGAVAERPTAFDRGQRKVYTLRRCPSACQDVPDLLRREWVLPMAALSVICSPLPLIIIFFRRTKTVYKRHLRLPA
ncbi:MAG: hypothetical protein ACLVEX_15165 [Ruthenibacterium lactatiformans]